uniref:Uncharacterized protein n=1 Tax=Fagus sylvatica TaxID=28930 RepID=A0A2N9HHL5_FAGSY
MWSISDRSVELRRVGKLLQRHLSRAWTMEKNKNQQGPRQEWEIDVTAMSGLVSVPTSPQTPSPSNSQTRQGKKTPEYGVLAQEPRFGSVYAETMRVFCGFWF